MTEEQAGDAHHDGHDAEPKGLSLLVIEDNDADARLVQELLHDVPDFRATIQRVETLGAAMVRIASGVAFDAALVDLNLPDSSGPQTLERLIARVPHLPLLVFSGSTAEGEGPTVHHAGEWLPKGRLSGEGLARAIRYAIDRKRVERELIEARAAADESARLQTALLMNMNHEVRTPLNIIGGFVDLMSARAKESGDLEQVEYAERVKRGCARLLNTMQGLLDLSRIQAGIQRTNPAPVDLATLVADRVDAARDYAEERGLTIEAVCEESPVVLADSYMLARALQNLIDNAVKFTGAGAVTVRLGRDERRRIRISVVDTGIGILEELAPRLFKPFSQVEDGNTRLFEGAGVGLAVAKHFAESNGATIAFTSKPCEGSTFFVTFDPGREIVSAQPEGPPVAIIAEDDPVSSRHLSTLFANRYSVLVAASHREFYDRLDEAGNRLRIVLLNPALGGEGEGTRLRQAVGAQERWRHVPVIPISNA